MKSKMLGTACLMGALVVAAPALAQELGPRQAYRGWFGRDSSAINSERPISISSGDELERALAPEPKVTRESGVARPESSKGAASAVRASFAFSPENVTTSALSSDMQPLNGCKCTTPGCGLHWTGDCFPRYGCPDDYCSKPFPRQCWPSYPPYYRCVPAGDCIGPACGSPGKDRLTWWFIPTPRALREALWLHP